MSQYDSLYASSPNVARVHTVYGDPVEETVRPNNTLDGVELAVGTIYRPYEKPKRRSRDGGKPLCDTEGCKAWPTATGHCVGHSRSMGLIPNWNKDGRKTDEPD